MAVHKTQGFVLKKEDVRETSVFLTLYTRDFGKIRLTSKGVRSPEQKFLSAYELFALDEIVFYERKRKGFFLLSQCELVDYFSAIRESLERISYAAYFVELVDCVTVPLEKNVRLYELLLKSLEFLSGRASPKRVARIFEIKLLSFLGLMPRLASCAGCDRALGKEAPARFSFSSGGVLCESCFDKDKRARSVLPGTVNFISRIENLPFDKVGQIKVSQKVGSEVERLLKDFINYHLDLKLRTREFIAKVGV